MALNLTTQLAGGFEGHYWRINSLTVNFATNSMVAIVSLYKDQAARLAGKPPVKSVTKTYALAPYLSGSLDIRASIYTDLQSTLLNGASNC